jgi:hypothetical protein
MAVNTEFKMNNMSQFVQRRKMQFFWEHKAGHDDGPAAAGAIRLCGVEYQGRSSDALCSPGRVVRRALKLRDTGPGTEDRGSRASLRMWYTAVALRLVGCAIFGRPHLLVHQGSLPCGDSVLFRLRAHTTAYNDQRVPDIDCINASDSMTTFLVRNIPVKARPVTQCRGRNLLHI